MKIKNYIDLIINKKNQLLEQMGLSSASSPSPSPSKPSTPFDLDQFLAKVPRRSYRESEIRHAHLNPLEPFILPRMFDVDTKTLKESGRKMTPEQYEKIFKETINLKNFMNEEQAPVLKKMYDDLKFIYEAMLPLKALDVAFTIDLTGGAVRDFVLGKADKIKDLDVMISLTNGYSAYRVSKVINDDFIKAGFTQEHLDAVNWGGESDWDRDPNVMNCKLIEMCFERHKCVTNKYYHSWASRQEPRGTVTHNTMNINGADVESDYDDTAKDRLQGVIKLAHPSCNYEIDLLITDLSKPEFLQAFDVDLCKASFSICNAYYQTTFPKDYSHLVSRFIGSQFFWADVLNKTLTIDTGGKSQKMMNSTIEKHLPRLQAKYPEHRVHFFHPSDPLDSVLEYANLTYNLNKQIPLKAPTTPTVKNKI